MYYKDTMLEKLIGKTVTGILMDEDNLVFETNEGEVCYGVEGDCCSTSYFFDFYGVKNVIGRKVIDFGEVNLAPGDVGYHKETYDTDDAVYGYRITVEHELFGEVSAVFSFRNESNGYYGGWMTEYGHKITDEQYRLTEDKIG